MRIEELFIDLFDGNDDLGLPGLSPGLNVIRFPSDAEAKQLSRFVPGILFGQPLGNSRPRGGTIMVQQCIAEDEPTLFDLSRVALPEGLSDLHVISANQSLSIDDLLWPNQLDGDQYNAIFTDNLSPQHRVRIWADSPLVTPLWSETRRVAGRVASSSSDVSSHMRASVAAHREQAIQHALETWQQARAAFEKITATGRNSSSPADAQGDSADGLARKLREEYLAAKRRAKQLRQQIPECRQRITELERERADLAVARQVDALRRRRDDLRRRLKADEANRPAKARSGVELADAEKEHASADMKRLARLDIDLAALRDQLQATRDAMKRSQEQVPKVAYTVDDAERDVKLIREVGERRRQAANRLQQALEPSNSDSASGRDQEGVARDELGTKALDRNGDNASASEQLRTTPSEGANDPVQPAPNEQPAFGDQDKDSSEDPRIANLQRQIRQLRDETRQLLARQLLSRPALIGIGVIFASGVAIMLAALLLDLNGAETSTGAIGLTCIVASALLKASFERAPSGQLQRQRLRIERLMDELSRLRTPLSAEDDASDQLFSTPRETSGADSGCAADDDRIQVCNNQLQEAEKAWQEVLADLNLEPVLQPDDAIVQIRQRVTASGEVRTERRASAETEVDEQSGSNVDTSANGADGDREKLVELQSQIKRYKQQRQAILDAAGVKSLKQWQHRIKAERTAKRKRLKRQQREIQDQIQAELGRANDADRTQQWLDADVDLSQLENDCRGRLRQAKSQLTDYQSDLKSCQASIERTAAKCVSSPSEARPADSGRSVDLVWESLELAGAVLRRLAATMAESSPAPAPTLSSTAERPAASADCRWIRLATKHLRKLADRPKWSIRWEGPESPLWVECYSSEDGSSGDRSAGQLFSELESDEQHLVALALQLSLVQCLGSVMEPMPLILRDASFRHTRRTCERIGKRLAQFGERNQQILLITSQSDLVYLFHHYGIPTLVVSRKDVAFDTGSARAAQVRGQLPDKLVDDVIQQPLEGPTTVEYQRFEPRLAVDAALADDLS